MLFLVLIIIFTMFHTGENNKTQEKEKILLILLCLFHPGSHMPFPLLILFLFVQ